jgi:SAM-dependent methyltransferase
MQLASVHPGTFSVPAPAVRRAGLLQRSAVWTYLQQHFPPEPQADVLVIGSGEGEDALYLNRLGHKVLGLEASPQKVAIAKRAAERDKCPEKPVYHNLDLGQIHGDRILARFDLIFAGFGVLNTLDEDSLARLLGRMPRLLKPSGQLVIVLMPPHSVWDAVGPLFFPKRKANRRTELHYHAPETVKGQLPIGLRVERLQPIGLALPPANVEAALGRRLTRQLKALESKLKAYPKLAGLAEHYVLHLQKVK